MAISQLYSNLLRAELLEIPDKGGFEYIGYNAPEVKAKQNFFPGKLIGLLESIPADRFVASNLSKSGGLTPVKVTGNLGQFNPFLIKQKYDNVNYA